MSQYFIIRGSNEKTHVYIENYVSDKNENWTLRLLKGEFIPSSDFDLQFIPGNATQKYPDFLSGRFSIVSDRLKDILLEMTRPDEIQVLPVSFTKSQPSTPYFLINPLQMVDWIDLDKSDLELYEGVTRIAELHQLVLKPDQENENHNLFRMKYMEDEVIISASILNRLKSEEISGFKVVPVENFKIGDFLFDMNF